MANEIQSGSNSVINSTSFVVDGALPATGVTAKAYTANQTHVVSFTVDAKGRLSAASNTAVKMTGVELKVGGAAASALVDQRVWVQTDAPETAEGEVGDVWYQVTS